MAAFFAELKRRNVYRVAAAYAVVAWLLLQIVNNIAPILDLPPWIARAVLMLLALGFPVTVLFAWVFEVTPDGIRRTARAVGAGDSGKTHAADWFLAAALAVVIALVSYQQLAPAPTAPVADDQAAGVVAARLAATAPEGAVSIAVLPFVNLSGDQNQEFFSDGMTEEITSALAKIADLRVVGRTSAFQFKGEKQDLRAIGQALNATHLLEGSVRKDGDRVRITSQLVRAGDGVSLWTSSYDRQLTDVFAIQEDIATAIAGAMRMPLGLRPGERLVADRTADQETYTLYLRGRAAVRSRDADAVTLLEQAVARDPSFAPAWAMLSEARRAESLSAQRQGGGQSRIAGLETAEAAARKAIALDTDLALGYATLAAVQRERGKWTEVVDLLRQALARDPEDPEVLYNYSRTLRTLGYLKEADRVSEQLSLLEPLNGLYNRQGAEVSLAVGKTEAGTRKLASLDMLGPATFTNPGVGGPPTRISLAAAYAQQGRFMDAADTLLRIDFPSGVWARPLMESAAQVLRAKANDRAPPAKLPAFNSELFWIYAYADRPERVLEWPEKGLKEGDYRPLQYLWWPAPPAARDTARFKTLVRDAGLVAYWRARGWPDLCRPEDAADFTCS